MFFLTTFLSCGFFFFLGNKNSAENMEELDEDLTVTQTQVNLICPLTQVGSALRPAAINSQTSSCIYYLMFVYYSTWLLVIQITHLSLAANGKPDEEQKMSSPLRRWCHPGHDPEETKPEEEVPVSRSPSASCWRVEAGFWLSKQVDVLVGEQQSARVHI